MEMKTVLLKVWRESGTPQTNCVSCGDLKGVCVCTSPAGAQLQCLKSWSRLAQLAAVAHRAKLLCSNGLSIPMSTYRSGTDWAESAGR